MKWAGLETPKCVTVHQRVNTCVIHLWIEEDHTTQVCIKCSGLVDPVAVAKASLAGHFPHSSQL